MKWIRILWVLAAVASGCSWRRIDTRLRLPPRLATMQSEQRVLVRAFDGARGGEVSRQVQRALVDGRLHKVVDRETRELRQQEIYVTASTGGTTDLAGAGPEGATVIVSGRVHDDEYSSNIETSQDKKCVAKDKQNRCTRYVDITHYTLKESCSVSLEARAIRVSSGEPLFDEHWENSASESNGKEGSRPDPVGRTLCNTAFASLPEQIVRLITPYDQSVRLEFRKVEDPDQQSNRAFDLIAQSEVARARALLETVAEDTRLDPEGRAWAHYNLAVVLWAASQFEACVEQLDEARRTLAGDSTVLGMRKACAEYVK